MFWTRLIIVVIAGALGAGLANRGIVLFSDALRSILPEVLSGRMRRREFASLAFGSTIGLALGFGLPFSIVSPILLCHALWLGTDVLGAWFPGPAARLQGSTDRPWLGFAAALLSGGVYGALLVALLEAFTRLAARLPLNIFSRLPDLSAPVIFTLAAIPPLTIAYQYGVRSGALALLFVLLARQAAIMGGLSSHDAWAFWAGMLVLGWFAFREARREPPSPQPPVDLAETARQVRRRLPWIAAVGAVYALASYYAVFMEGPQSLLALATGDRLAALGYTLARALSFLPMRSMSILATGVFTMEGLGLAPAAGLVTPSAWAAALAGALLMCAEALGLVAVAHFFNRYPCMMKLADSLRTAMTKLLEVAMLTGGALAAQALAPGLGLFTVIALFVLNEAAGTPVIRVAVGPVAVITVGVILNVLVYLGLA